LKNVAELKMGDPLDEKTDIGPLIDLKSAERVESWIKEAVEAGGKILAGGKRQGDAIAPTLVENAPARCKLSCEEAFGPVATIEPVGSRSAALEKMASGVYGLQAGIFTNDLRWVMEAWSKLPVGGLIVNDIPAFRSDAMPYGGVRDSGIGREGVRYAMEEFTELRTLVLKP
jgi:acyl-CoA reductase-like NAD-dependent aldehyde dehydrogenase